MALHGAVAMAIALLLAPTASEQVGAQEIVVPPSNSFWTTIETIRGDRIIKAACCKTCRKGKACGNSCISKSYRCTKAPGCACDG